MNAKQKQKLKNELKKSIEDSFKILFTDAQNSKTVEDLLKNFPEKFSTDLTNILDKYF